MIETIPDYSSTNCRSPIALHSWHVQVPKQGLDYTEWYGFFLQYTLNNCVQY